MTSSVAGPDATTEDVVRRAARVALTVAVRGRRGAGGPWGEAVLAELDHTRGRWEAVRWSAGGIRAALRERRALRADLPRGVRIGRRVAAVLVSAVLAGVGVQHWVLTPVYQPGAAMEPTLGIADVWLMDRLGYRVSGLRYGDVVAYTADGAAAAPSPRRVIGLPGDVIGCRDGRVQRNGLDVTETYLAAGTTTPADICPTLTVPAGDVYLLADNRVNSVNGNPVRMDRIEGRMLTRLWNAGPDGFRWAPPSSTESVTQP